MTVAERSFGERVELAFGHEWAGSTCWRWTGTMNNRGYGSFQSGGAKNSHRYSYMLHRGAIPSGLVLDHLCRNRWCCNPWHLEPVTQQENLLRGATNSSKTHCKHGHEYTPENTYRTPDGSRQCMTCRRERQLGYNRRTRGDSHHCP